MIFALCLTVASVAYKDWNKYLLKSLSFSIIFITFLLVFVFLFRNLLTITNAPDLMSRNGWAASSVLYLVIFHQKNRLLKYSGFSGLLYYCMDYGLKVSDVIFCS